jgi:hypothetical protein
MQRSMRNFLLIFILLLSLVGYTRAQSDTLLVADLQPSWRMASDGQIVPMVDIENFQGRTLFIPLELQQYKGQVFRIYAENAVSLFHNDQWLDLLQGEHWYDIDSLISIFGERTVFTLYDKRLDPYKISSGIYSLSGSREDLPVSIDVRSGNVTRNVFIFTFFFMLVYLALLYYLNPRSVQEFFWVTRAISFRELDENLIKTRPLSSVNLSFYVLLALLGSWVIMVLLILTENPIGRSFFTFDSFLQGLWVWIRFAALIFVLLILKYILIWTFKELFRIKAFIHSHYYNYVRLGLLVYVLFAGILFVSYFTFFKVDPAYYQFLGYLLLSALILRVIILFFKLMNSSSHSVLHLFSYLCGTELIPLLIVVSVGFNQIL